MFSYGFYDPSSNYGYKPSPGPWGEAKNYMETYPAQSDIELNKEAYFTHLLGQRGYGGMNNKSNVARNMFGRISDAYNAAWLKNNELKWKDFVDPIDFDKAINELSYADRGINSSNSAPRDVRWLQR